MKKLFLLSIVIILLGVESYSQKGKEVILGLGGAFTNVWIIKQNFYGEPEVDYAAKTGYAFSAILGYSFTEQISAVTEIQYSGQGQKYEGKQGSYIKVQRDIKLNYLNIPVFFKYSFGSGGTRFRFLAGPQFGFLMGAKQDYVRDGNVIGSTQVNLDGEVFVTDTEDIKDRFENLDIGAAIDIGADIYLNKNFFVSAGGRINYGFKDINAAAYRLDALNEKYEPSHNFWGGAYVGIIYLLDVEGYKQRSF